jgi:hypothetical protein
MVTDKARENRIRRTAERRGYRLEKSRRRDPLAVDFGGYMLIHARLNAVVLGSDPVAYTATLDEVEAALNDPKFLGHADE